MEDKWIGLLLAMSSSLAIGTSFIITKKGLNDTAAKNDSMEHASDSRAYLSNPIWWAGITTLIIGEAANFAAYTFAPPILVTPLGALSVLIGAILASFFLGEELGPLGRIGCALCLLGSLIIVLHAPPDKEIQSVDEMLSFATQPGFMLYCFTVLVFTLYMIYRVSPRYGKQNPLVYISICSLVGSISVMSIKGFGVAVKLTFAGNNQFTRPSTYVFAIVVGGCIAVQMNYFNKALDTFSTNVVNPMYYVGFSTATIVASLILFQGFNTTDSTNTISLIAGFVVTFLGVQLLNMSRHPETVPVESGNGHGRRISSLDTGLVGRRGERSIEAPWSPAFPYAGGHARRSSLYRAQNLALHSSFGGDEESGMGMDDLREEDEEDDEFSRLNSADRRDRPSPAMNSNGRPLNGSAR
ncbi:DUF803-domain-containing protein [Clavulina sp. PMI_390]|nr:DUF803-domain-containing protein [Clavulina sp. PMI_390]